MKKYFLLLLGIPFLLISSVPAKAETGWWPSNVGAEKTVYYSVNVDPNTCQIVSYNNDGEPIGESYWTSVPTGQQYPTGAPIMTNEQCYHDFGGGWNLGEYGGPPN